MFSLVAEQQLSTFDIMEELLRDQRTKFSILAGQVLCLSLMPVFVFLFECFLDFLCGQAPTIYSGRQPGASAAED